MFKKISFLSVLGLTLSACASVPLAGQEQAAQAKKFEAPAAGMAGIYIYRDSFVGQSIKRDVSIDGKCIGKTANNMFFYTSVEGDKQHIISTEGETGRHDLQVMTESGKNYFVQQEMTMGMWSASSKLKIVSEEKGEKEIQGLKLATSGDCS